MKYREKIDKWCDDKRGNAADLARALGMPDTIVYKIRRKDYTLSIEQALVVARTMGVSLDWLIDPKADWPPILQGEERALDEGEAEILRFARTMRSRVSVDELLDRMALAGLTQSLAKKSKIRGVESDEEAAAEDRRRESEKKPKRRGGGA